MLAEKIYELLKKVPKGRITTYKELAIAAGTKSYRAIGQILKRNPYAPTVPCHRVVKSDGTIGGFKGKKQSTEKKKMLEKEGIAIKNKKIILFKEKIMTAKEILEAAKKEQKQGYKPPEKAKNINYKQKDLNMIKK